MTQQSEAYDQFIDRLIAGENKCSAFEDFARSALEEIGRISVPIRPLNLSAWPEETRAEIEAIRKGEKP